MLAEKVKKLIFTQHHLGVSNLKLSNFSQDKKDWMNKFSFKSTSLRACKKQETMPEYLVQKYIDNNGATALQDTGYISF